MTSLKFLELKLTLLLRLILQKLAELLCNIGHLTETKMKHEGKLKELEGKIIDYIVFLRQLQQRNGKNYLQVGPHVDRNFYTLSVS